MKNFTNDKMLANVTKLIGNTPLIEFPYGIDNAKIFVKLETYNLTGSVKDRMALFMLKEAIKAKKVRRGTTIIEATTGNTGIAFAALSNLYGCKMIAIIPKGQSKERVEMMKAYGAEVIETPQEEGPMGSIIKRDSLAKEIPNSWVPDQFSNPDNVKEHMIGTAQEILKQLKDKHLDYIIHGIGTGGTLMGVGKVLKEKFPSMKIIALEPVESAVLSGGKPRHHNIQGIGEGFIPSIVERNAIDEIVTVSTEEAIKEAHNITHTTGLLVGFSSGANIVGIKKLAKKENGEKTFLTFFADRGERYLSV